MYLEDIWVLPYTIQLSSGWDIPLWAVTLMMLLPWLLWMLSSECILPIATVGCLEWAYGPQMAPSPGPTHTPLARDDVWTHRSTHTHTYAHYQNTVKYSWWPKQSQIMWPWPMLRLNCSPQGRQSHRWINSAYCTSSWAITVKLSANRG